MTPGLKEFFREWGAKLKAEAKAVKAEVMGELETAENEIVAEVDVIGDAAKKVAAEIFNYRFSLASGAVGLHDIELTILKHFRGEE